MKKMLLLLLLLAPNVEAAGAVYYYNWRVLDSSDDPTRAIPQHIVADAEADLPTSGVVSGSTAFALDTLALYAFDGAAWNSVAGAGGPHDLLSAAHSDTSAAAVGIGYLIRGDNGGNRWEALIPTVDGDVLTLVGGVPDWVTPTSGSTNTAEVEVDFGSYPGSSIITQTVTGVTWVTSTSIITCGLTMMATSTRSEGAEDPIIEQMTIAVHSRNDFADTFQVTMAPAMGNALGKYLIHCIGG